MHKFKTTNIKGKDYVEVNQRLLYFRNEPTFAGWSIESDLVDLQPDRCCIKAIIRDADGRIRATGHAHEDRTSSMINKTSYVENAETSAIGRALATLGLGGTEFASADEVANAIYQQKNPPKPQDIKPTSGAGDNLDDEVKQWVIDQALEIIGDWDSENFEAAYDRYTLVTDSDQKVFLWSKLPSHVRTGIKKIGTLNKEQ